MTYDEICFLTPPDFVHNGALTERVFGCTFQTYDIPNVLVLPSAQMLRDNGFRVKLADLSRTASTDAVFRERLRDMGQGLYVLYTVNLSMEPDISAARTIRQELGKVPIVFMGPAPTYAPGDFLMDENTYVVRGEFELTLLELAQRLREGWNKEQDLSQVQGVTYLKDGQRIDAPSRPLIKDLDTLKIPSPDLLQRRDVAIPKMGVHPVAFMLSSRGCPYPCTFCVPNSLSFARQLENERDTGRKPIVRMRSVDNVLAEARALKEQGYKGIDFLDDQFIWGEERTLALANGLKELGLKWGCLARADRITEKIAQAMADGGCVFIDIGVESFDPAILEDVKKKITIEQIRNAVRILKKYGIQPKLNIMFGASTLETKDTIRRTVRMAEELDPSGVMYSICNPVPGTAYHDTIVEGGMLRTESYVPTDSQKGALIDLPHLSAGELEKMLRWANWHFYFRPRFILQNISLLWHPKQLTTAMRALYRKLIVRP